MDSGDTVTGIRSYRCEKEDFSIAPYSCDLPNGINTMLRKNVPYHSNANVPTMTKPPYTICGIVWAHDGQAGHLTECPEKGKKKIVVSKGRLGRDGISFSCSQIEIGQCRGVFNHT